MKGLSILETIVTKNSITDNHRQHIFNQFKKMSSIFVISVAIKTYSIYVKWLAISVTIKLQNRLV